MPTTTKSIRLRGRESYGLARSIGDALREEGVGNIMIYCSFGAAGEKVYKVSDGSMTPLFHLNQLLADVAEKGEHVDVVLYTAPEIAQRVLAKLG